MASRACEGYPGVHSLGIAGRAPVRAVHSARVLRNIQAGPFQRFRNLVRHGGGCQLHLRGPSDGGHHYPPGRCRTRPCPPHNWSRRDRLQPSDRGCSQAPAGLWPRYVSCACPWQASNFRKNAELQGWGPCFGDSLPRLPLGRHLLFARTRKSKGGVSCSVGQAHAGP